MADVVMPRLSDSMEEGTILRWLKRSGEAVRRGEELAEIETDKATMTYEADTDGVLEILAPEGTTLPIGEVIARLGAGVDHVSEGAEGTAGGDSATRETLPPTEPSPDAPVGEDASRVRASPVARRVARDRGIDLHRVTGTGPGGRIVRADVEGVAPGAPPPSPPTDTSPGAVDTNRGAVTTVQTSRTQQVIARRMAESRATIPSFEVSTEVDMDAAVSLRAQAKALAGADAAPSYNDLVIKACALALREHPRVNGTYKDGSFELYERINIGVAVAAADALVVPVIDRADEKALSHIAAQSRLLASRVRDGVITPPEVSGGTFTVSNLGMLGVSAFTAVINPGQAAILAVGALVQRPVVRDGDVVPGYTITLTLTSDHRILYGADSARFLARVREFLEHPLAMML